MAPRSKIIAVVVTLLSIVFIAVVLLSQPQKAEKTISKSILQGNDAQQQTLKRLEESLRSNGMSDVSVVATEAFTIESMSKAGEGLYAIITITSNTESLAGYFDYVWHRSVLMREAILISQNNPAPLILGEVRVLNSKGKQINKLYTGNIASELQSAAQKQYFTEIQKSELDDDATKKFLAEKLKLIQV